jgi:hypothetical protein
LEYPVWQINNEKLFHLEERTVSRTTTETDENGNVDDHDRSYKTYKLVSNAEFTNPSNPLEKIN